MTAAPYHPRLHGAQHTSEFLYAQLLPYLGSKRKLLPLIAEAVRQTGVCGGTFADLFAGSGVVSRWAKMSGFRVVANDWEPYAEAVCGACIGLNEAPLPPNVFDELNALAPVDGYLTHHFCPADDQSPDPDHERCFFTRANGRRLDAMRERIAVWDAAGLLTHAARAYLLAPLLYSAAYVSNTSGVFKAYHHGWGGQTHTALYRILSPLRLSPPPLWDNGQCNPVLRMDAGQLAAQWEALSLGPLEIAYLDPPYNQHPYGSNYHLLNTVALWDKPPVPPFGPGGKSGIRTDWRAARRSSYNHTASALNALTSLVDALPARWALLSYSTDGNIPADVLLDAMTRRGMTHLLTRRYKRYRVSTPRMSPRPHTTEFILTLDKAAPPQPSRIDAHRQMLQDAQKTEI